MKGVPARFSVCLRVLRMECAPCSWGQGLMREGEERTRGGCGWEARCLESVGGTAGAVVVAAYAVRLEPLRGHVNVAAASMLLLLLRAAAGSAQDVYPCGLSLLHPLTGLSTTQHISR